MSYDKESKFVIHQKDLLNDGVKNTSDIADVLDPCTIVRIGVLVTVIADAVMTITVTRRILTGSDTNEVALGTLTVPNTTAVGKVVYKDITPQDANVGDQIEWAISNDGTSTAFQSFAVAIPRAEVPANQSDMIASA